MFHKINLTAGVPHPINRDGRFFQLITAGEDLSVVLRGPAGESFFDERTKMREGMKISLPSRINEVTFTSDVAQTIEFWLGDTDLDYSASSLVAVGAKLAESGQFQAFTNETTELVPARPGRQKITIQPSQDLFIGGANVTQASAIKIPAGGSMDIETQSSLHGFTGKTGYQPVLVADFDGPMVAQSLFSSVSSATFASYYAAADRYFAAGSLGDGDVLYRAGTATSWTTVAGAKCGCPRIYESPDELYVCSDTHGVQSINKATLAVTTLPITGYTGTRVWDWARRGSEILVAEGDALKLHHYDGAAWSTIPAPTLTGYMDGILWLSDGTILVGDRNGTELAFFWRSTDQGQSWQSVAIPNPGDAHSGGELRIFKNQTTDRIYYCAKNDVVHYSDNAGDSWGALALLKGADTNYPAEWILAIGDRVYVVGVDGVGYSNDGGQSWAQTHPKISGSTYPNGLGLGDDGSLLALAGTSGNMLYRFNGSVSNAGGLKIPYFEVFS